MKRAWKITKARGTDLKTGKVDRGFRESIEDQVGICSRSWKEDQADQAIQKFRLVDDDGIIYVEGVATPDVDFEPLDDYGMGGLGCVGIQFLEAKRGWTFL